MGSAIDKLSKRVSASPLTTARVIEVPIGKIRFDPLQPRKAFHHLDGRVAASDEEALAELAESIRSKKLIHPITVREVPDGTYFVVVGERRTRAHLLLGFPTIRAVVRNDLLDPAKRLLYQLAENIDRSDLTPEELAESIRDLMAGTEGTAPMSQVEIAKAMGKSEGWVVRYVRFGDEELQRVWVKSGIADTPEKLYRLSILPVPLQMDIRRRVELPEDHPERLEKPLKRDEIDRLKRQWKVVDKVDSGGAHSVGLPVSAVVAAGAPSSASISDASESFAQTGGVASDDVIGQAFATAANEGRLAEGRQESAPGVVQGINSSDGVYQLAPDARAAILGMAPASSVSGSDVGDVVAPPVRCRVSIANLIALVDVLKSSEKLLDSVRATGADINIPGPLAQLVANELMGVIVDDKEVSATLQNELSKLH